MNPFRTLYRKLHRFTLQTLNRFGLNLARTGDYYSPLPVRAELARKRDRWDRPSELVGVDFDLEAMRRELRRLIDEHGAELDELPSYEETKRLGYGPGFTEIDALVLYLVLRRHPPRRFVEIGSGLSTYYASLALERNADEGNGAEIVCIDPYARDAVADLPVATVRAEPVQEVDPSYFAALERDDVLFIDSTHVVKIDGDVPHLYLEVVPRLADGVLVHSHDIHFPYNTPYPAEEYVFGAKWPMLWTEAMLLQAFLAFNADFELFLSLPMLRHVDEAFLAATLPDYRPVEPRDYDTHFGSVWFRRDG